LRTIGTLALLLLRFVAAISVMAEERPPHLAKEILSYYVKHPTAADTYEGLARWRLLEEYVEQTTHDTEKAVDWLVSHGFLAVSGGLGNRRVFVLNADRRQDAETFVDDQKEEGRGDR
jgi:hypothetical protein